MSSSSNSTGSGSGSGHHHQDQALNISAIHNILLALMALIDPASAPSTNGYIQELTIQHALVMSSGNVIMALILILDRFKFISPVVNISQTPTPTHDDFVRLSQLFGPVSLRQSNSCSCKMAKPGCNTWNMAMDSP